MARSFPGATRVRALAVLVAGGLLCAGAPAPVAARPDHAETPDLRHRQHRVEGRIHGAHRDLDESSNRLREATSALAVAERRLAAARTHLADTRGQLATATVLDRRMQARLDDARARLRQARAELAAGQQDIAAERRDLGRIVATNYQSGDPSLMGLSMVLTSQDPTDLTGQLNSVQNVLDKESVALERLDASRALLTVQAREVAAAKDAVAQRRRQAAANLARRQELESRAQAATASVRGLVAGRSTARSAAARARRADLSELVALQRERDRIGAILRRRAEAARRRAAAAGRPVVAGRLRSHGFLDYPVAGPVTSPFGWRIHPIYGYRSLHDGIDFGAACGTPLRAPAAGRVLERYYQTAWGNRVVIDHGYHHGVGLATIINHMSAPALVAPGQHVRRGQVVGYVGTTGWSTGCHLHFTVLQNGVAVNPMDWL